MLNFRIKKWFVILSILLSIVSMKAHSDEVSTRRQMIEKYDSFSSQETEPYIFCILHDNKLCLEKIIESFYKTVEPPKYPYSYRCTTLSGVEHYILIDSVIKESYHKNRFANNRIAPFFKYNPHNVFPSANALPPTPPDRMRFFFHLWWNEMPIGCFSYGHRFGNMPGNSVCFAYSVRGNIEIQISISFIPIHMYSKGSLIEGIGNSPGCDMDELFEEDRCFFTPDLREIAWRIDQYLKGDPLEKFGDDEKARLKTLELTLPNEQFEQGKEYPLDFPRKLSDGTVPAEIRLVVSRGEIQQVIDKAESEDSNALQNPASLAPDINGNYTVLFGQPGVQTVHCYHINEEGKCLAWGMLTQKVSVRHSPPPRLRFIPYLDVPKDPWNVNDSNADDTKQPWVSALEFTIETAGTKGKGNDVAALSQLTTYLHSGHGLTYDTMNGAPTYSGWYATRNGNFPAYDFNVANFITQGFGNVVNCYDQVAALTTFGRLLGMDVRYTYLDSFGYINQTTLVGGVATNNPFFQCGNSYYSSNSIINLTNVATDSNVQKYRRIYDVSSSGTSLGRRSSFGNHAFVTLGNAAYDACAGPIVNTNITTYFSNVIDFAANKHDNQLSVANGYTAVFYETVGECVSNILYYGVNNVY